MRGRIFGAALSIHSSPPLLPYKGQVMDEHLLFSHADISITSQHLNVHGKIYAVSDIHTVESRLIEQKRFAALILLFTGLVLLLDEGSLFALGGFCVLLGIVLWVSGGTRYSVVIHTSDGKYDVVSSDDRLFTEKVIHALDTAILNNANSRPGTRPDTSYSENSKDISFGAS